MLTTLRIRDLAIIEDLTVEFGAGLNVLTGETGAGKSILVDALGLAAGDRADSSRVRTGSERAIVEASFDLRADSAALAVLATRGIEAPDGELVVRREVSAAGGGRVLVNGSPCPLAVLREVGEEVVELHGQHEHQSLLRAERQEAMLDRFGDHADAVDAVASAHAGVLAARTRLEELREAARAGRQREEEVALLVQEIDAAQPKPGEFDALERERRLLQSAGRAALLLDEAATLVYDGEPAAAGLAAAAARRAHELAAIDPSLTEIAERIDAARLELQDAGASLRDYLDRARFDPARLEFVESRRALLERLRLRYGNDEQGILDRRDALARELATLRRLDAEIESAALEIGEREGRYARLAEDLTGKRDATAGRLTSRLEEELGPLSLPKARVEIRWQPSSASAVSLDGRAIPLHPRGAERAEFLLAANVGEEPRPLAKVASGGELSRVMLALHVALGGASAGRVLVFDEVDAGIGGAVADAVGARLARLGTRHQVLCVTHLAQVAAHAHRHYHVRKRTGGGRTRAEIALLDEEGRVEELARMIGGREVTPSSRRHAAELLGAAERRGAGYRRGA